jgi:DNA-binding Xre family transcriptional regulator
MCDMTQIITTDRLTILLGRLQANTGQRVTLRGLAARAGVPKDLVYRLDAGQARYVDLDALASLCLVLRCTPADILLWRPVPEQVTASVEPLLDPIGLAPGNGKDGAR